MSAQFCVLLHMINFYFCNQFSITVAVLNFPSMFVVKKFLFLFFRVLRDSDEQHFWGTQHLPHTPKMLKCMNPDPWMLL